VPARIKQTDAIAGPTRAGACAAASRGGMPSRLLTHPGDHEDAVVGSQGDDETDRPAGLARRVLADFVCSVEPGAADGVACDGGDCVIEGEAGGQARGLVEGEELEGVGVGAV